MPVVRERLDRVAAHAHPLGAREVRLHQVAPDADRHPERASRSHGTWATEKPVGPAVKTVPLNRKSSGISPSRSACR